LGRPSLLEKGGGGGSQNLQEKSSVGEMFAGGEKYPIKKIS